MEIPHKRPSNDRETSVVTNERCEGCQTPTCFTPYPDDDHPAFAGKMRGCFADKSRSVSFDSSYTQFIRAKDVSMERDNLAYKRLRKDGIQPPRVDGSAKLEATMK